MVDRDGFLGCSKSWASKSWRSLVVSVAALSVCAVLACAWSSPALANTWHIARASALAFDQSHPKNPALVLLQNQEVSYDRRDMVSEGGIVRFDSKGHTHEVVAFTDFLAGLSDVVVLEKGKLLVVTRNRVVQMARDGDNQKTVLSTSKSTLLSTNQLVVIDPMGVAQPNLVRGRVGGVEGVWAFTKNRFGKWVATPQQMNAVEIASRFNRDGVIYGGGHFGISGNAATYTGPNDSLEINLTNLVNDIERAVRQGDTFDARDHFENLKKLATAKTQTGANPPLPLQEIRWRVQIAITELKYRLRDDFVNLQFYCRCSRNCFCG